MRPYLASTMCFCAARLIRKLPRRCTLSTVSQSSSDILNSRLSRSRPALLTSTVGPPSSLATRLTAASTWSVWLTSAPTPRARPPASVISLTVPRQLCSSRSSTATAMPSAARRRATAAPMPRPAPVTMATRCVSCDIRFPPGWGSAMRVLTGQYPTTEPSSATGPRGSHRDRRSSPGPAEDPDTTGFVDRLVPDPRVLAGDEQGDVGGLGIVAAVGAVEHDVASGGVAGVCDPENVGPGRQRGEEGGGGGG